MSSIVRRCHRADREPGHNPFSTRYVRPGAVPYLFPPDCSVEGLIDRLRADGWWGQIIGPHGSGKSSLLAALTPALAAGGRRIVRFDLHDGQRRLGAAWRKRGPLDAASLLVVDGYEQLGLLSKLGLKRHCRRRGAGLLVTAHSDIGLPTLFACAPTVETAQRIVERLLPPGDQTIDRDDVARAWQSHAGDLREALFGLYDLYEQRRACVTPRAPG
ncbi:MAG TPA: hypothetical protein VGX76_24920 [Pirellulales bacterium]|nr:hypothetical protein [Pirellulales bacterium]